MITVRDRIKIAAQIEVLEDIAIEYRGKTIDNIIQQLETGYDCPSGLEYVEIRNALFEVDKPYIFDKLII